jgi:protein gp37
MAPRKPDSEGSWWDWTWSTMGGCRPISPGCDHCFAARDAATLQESLDVEIYRNVTKFADGDYTFNGILRELRPGHEAWDFPVRWRGAAHPLLGEGKPSLIWACGLTEIFLRWRSKAVIDRTLGTLASSDHIGLVLSKLPGPMVAYFAKQHPATQRHLRQKLWVGFSAEDQAHFDLRWPAMRPLAEQGWLVFCSVAPMIGPVRLPDDFLSLARWLIVSGEQGPFHVCRPMDSRWARALRDQCAEARVAFFLKQMGMKRPIPPDLRRRQFPAVVE